MRLIRSPVDGDVIDAYDTMYPSRLEVVGSSREFSSRTSSYYGCVVSGRARVSTPGLEATFEEGGFFGLPGPMAIEVEAVGAGGAGGARGKAASMVVVIERVGYRALPTMGRSEPVGRLSYIDGCSDSILVMPPRQGDPVYNHLHFPSGVKQAVHCHPTIRLGVVLGGNGHAYGPGAYGSDGWEEPLETHAVFMLLPQEMHAFRTDKSGSSMDVIAYHPDSDWGPTDGAHPMLNRTYRQ